MLAAALWILAAAVACAGWAIARAIDRSARERAMLAMIAAFGAAAAAREDPRALLAWAPVANTARTLFPDAFRRLDAARGARFPFTPDDAHAAHARCTAEWLAWERAHDAEYKLKASALEQEIGRGPDAGTPVGRARIEAVDREKLERYQRRYEEYIRTAKALQALVEAHRPHVHEEHRP